VWTARVMDDVRRQVLAAGVEMFIPKPCDIQLVALQVTQLAQSVVTLAT
jgi:CheY-like chemotaxis protein